LLLKWRQGELRLQEILSFYYYKNLLLPSCNGFLYDSFSLWREEGSTGVYKLMANGKTLFLNPKLQEKRTRREKIRVLHFLPAFLPPIFNTAD